MKIPKKLDAIADAVLAYRPKARSKPAVQRKRRRTILQKQQAMNVLAPNMPESGLVDACRQVKQAAISEADNAEKLEAERDRLRVAVGKFLEKWPAVEKAVNSYVVLHFARTRQQYSGPTIGAEVDDMRQAHAALSAAPPDQE